jgi:hypothetical protein
MTKTVQHGLRPTAIQTHLLVDEATAKVVVAVRPNSARGLSTS